MHVPFSHSDRNVAASDRQREQGLQAALHICPGWSLEDQVGRQTDCGSANPEQHGI
jgi:hypothetical protein